MFRSSLLPALLLLAAGCIAADAAEEPFWVEKRLEHGPPMRDLMHAAQLAMMRADFPPGETDSVGGVATSGWDVHLSPYSERGYRSQAVVEIERLDEPRSYLLRVRVRTQVNTEKHKTLDPAAADWEDRLEDPERARVVMQQLLIQVAPRSGRGGRVQSDQAKEPR
ncbi:MAG: hypothetical protein D6702_02760 [Planctomycetota bacterium]|nr:MAG: hypothetical protein D6702_02760 [Planctomycetota bacterium]